MKKIIVFLCMLCLFLSHERKLKAETNIDVSGKFIMTGIGANNLDNLSNNTFTSDKSATFDVLTRIDLSLTITQSENLSAHLRLQAPAQEIWGNNSFAVGGGALGEELILKQAYIDWFIPTTNIKFRLGMQPFELNSTLGSAIISDPAAGASLFMPIDQNINLSLHWFRINSDLSLDSYTNDIFALKVPMDFDKISITPWFLYGIAGNDFLQSQAVDGFISNPQTLYGKENLWLGFNSELNILHSFTLELGFTYASSDDIINPYDAYSSKNAQFANLGKFKSKGWLVDGAISYNGKHGIPKLFAWYASGDGDNVLQDKELGRIPLIASGWIDSTSAFFTQSDDDFLFNANVLSPTGTWAIGLAYDGLQPITDLNMGGHVMFIQGTNDTKNIELLQNFSTKYLTKNDSIWEFAIYAIYDIYKHLQVSAGFNYLISDLDSAWNGIIEKNAYRAYLGVEYTF